MDNLSEQFEEIEALNAIYGNQWKVESETNSYSIQISPDVKLFITLDINYPSSSPPHFDLLAPTLALEQKQRISEEFQNIYENGLGSPILFQWIEKLKEIVEKEQNFNCYPTGCVDKPVNEKEEEEVTKVFNLQVVHGPPIQDRKSVFQGHACFVQSQEETKLFMEYLLENKKIAQATHNILAYRITTLNGAVLQDYDDDGETHAGGRVLHLLQILNLTNVMVVVSRWYGGIHLGPDRFKHINNAARQVLLQGGFMQS